VVVENEKLREQLETTKREHLAIVKQTLQHSDVTRPNTVEGGEAPSDSAALAS